jgi:group I intron endonuclease
MEIYGYIYLVRNRESGKVYVGQTIRPVEIRWKAHLYSAKYGAETYLAVAIRKYGPDSFTVETLATCADLDTLNKLEHYFIKYVFQSTNPLLGYNLNGGGDSLGSFSDETKVKMSATQRSPKIEARKSNKQKGRVFSDEHRAKLSAAAKVRKQFPVPTPKSAKRAETLRRRRILSELLDECTPKTRMNCTGCSGCIDFTDTSLEWPIPLYDSD